MAERMGLSPQFLGRIERGEQNLTIRSLVRLANVLGVPLHELVCK